MKKNRSLILIFAGVVIGLIVLIILLSRLPGIHRQPDTAISDEQAALLPTDSENPLATAQALTTTALNPTSITPLTRTPTLEQEMEQIISNTPKASQTSTYLAFSATPTDSPASQPTATPTEAIINTPFDWTGSWTVYFGDEGGLLFRATLIITREGNTITGVHSTQVFTGYLSEDGLTVSGTWVNPPTSGTFSWMMVSENQFCGNKEEDFAYCGARSGATRPDPCFCLPPEQ